MNTIERNPAAAEAATYSAFRPVFLVPALLASLLVVAGCSVAPTYQRPDVTTPTSFKEAPTKSAPAVTDAAPAAGNWKPAQPAEEIARGEWWKIFNDETLNKLELRIPPGQPGSSSAAAARLGQARALEKNARAGLFPQVGVGFGPTRQQQSPASLSLPPNADTDPYTPSARPERRLRMRLISSVASVPWRMPPASMPSRMQPCSSQRYWHCSPMLRRPTS